MKITYKNKKTGEIRQYQKPNKKLEESKDWKRVGIVKDTMMRGYEIITKKL